MIKDIAVLTPLFVTLFWGIVLLGDFSKSKPKFLLGVFMFITFLLYLTHAFFFTQNYLSYFHTESIYLLTSLSVYPLYYCYIKLLTIESIFKSRNLLHFVPAVLFGLASLITGLFFTDQQRLEYVEIFVMQRDTSHFELLSPSGIKSMVFIISRIIFIIQVFYYLLNGILLTQQHDRRIANFYSNGEGKSLFWVKMVTLSFLVTSVMSITFAIIGRNLFLLNEYLLLIPSFIFSSLLYLIGYLGNITHSIIVESYHYRPQSGNVRIDNTEVMKEKMMQLFKDDKIFKNPDLLLSNLSDTLHLSSANVSKLINEEFKTDFRDFVNKYRVSVAKELIVSNLNNGLTIEEISVESGFGSLNAFIRVFKSYEGITPEQYFEISRHRKFPNQ
jgi:AraC-like DNA-binding protein